MGNMIPNTERNVIDCINIGFAINNKRLILGDAFD